MEPLRPPLAPPLDTPNRREVSVPIGYIEIFSRTGKVRRRIPVRQMGLRLGRAFDNDIILDDPYVCPHHAYFQWDGTALQVADLESVNGMLKEGERKKEGHVSLASGDRLRVGRTVLRFCGADMPVAGTLIERSLRGPLRFFEHPLFLAASYMMLIIYAALNFHLDATDKFDELKFAFGMFALIAMVIGWSALWSFASRIIIHRWNFFIHCAITSLGIIGFSFFEVLTSYVSFAFGMDGLLPLMGSTGYALLTAFIVYFQLRYVSQAAPAQLARASAAVAVTIVGLLLAVGSLQQKQFSIFPRYSATLKPLHFKVVKSRHPDRFFDLSGDFRQAVDERSGHNR